MSTAIGLIGLNLHAPMLFVLHNQATLAKLTDNRPLFAHCATAATEILNKVDRNFGTPSMLELLKYYKKRYNVAPPPMTQQMIKRLVLLGFEVEIITALSYPL